jgi:hypothetical protein
VTHPLRQFLSGPLIRLLVTKWEEDILPRVLTRMAPYCDAIYALAGDEPSHTLLAGHEQVAKVISDSDVGAAPFRDWHRQTLIEMAQVDWPPRLHGNGWFLILHGDEIWHDDPIECAFIAEHLPQKPNAPGWDTVVAEMAQSYLSHRTGDWVEFPACREERMFRNVPGLHYGDRQNGRITPLGISQTHWAEYRPVIRHHTYRSADQSWRMAWDSYTLRRVRQASHDWILERRTAYTDYSPQTGHALTEWHTVSEKSAALRDKHIGPRVAAYYELAKSRLEG